MKKLFVLGCVLLACNVNAEVYKCKNEQGSMIFQDSPCVKKTKVRSQEEIKQIIKSKNKKPENKNIASNT